MQYPIASRGGIHASARLRAREACKERVREHRFLHKKDGMRVDISPLVQDDWTSSRYFFSRYEFEGFTFTLRIQTEDAFICVEHAEAFFALEVMYRRAMPFALTASLPLPERRFCPLGVNETSTSQLIGLEHPASPRRPAGGQEVKGIITKLPARRANGRNDFELEIKILMILIEMTF